MDEDDQTILTSFLFNILTVIAMKDNSELWQLSEVSYLFTPAVLRLDSILSSGRELPMV